MVPPHSLERHLPLLLRWNIPRLTTLHPPHPKKAHLRDPRSESCAARTGHCSMLRRLYLRQNRSHDDLDAEWF